MVLKKIYHARGVSTTPQKLFSSPGNRFTTHEKVEAGEARTREPKKSSNRYEPLPHVGIEGSWTCEI